MTGTTGVRVATKQRLVEMATADITDATVSYSPPNGHVPNLAIFLGSTTGRMGIPTLQAGRQQRDDTFTVAVVFAVSAAGTSNGEEADIAAWALFQAFDSMLADAPTLNGQVTGLHLAEIGEVHGPDPDPFEMGFASVIVAEVECTTRSS